ncbi:hypothetical protein GOBAR_AA24757 [Gossypium barbadense]|uniref:Xylanase inhibitor C-terminal domain-containing protein n=2 Tax=Gossypium TaxID=3633 RepID=A0ABR0P647_GOSAR|nr:hypothetical protein PVK06_029238 [Gossypium arboreum]PPR95918.1 hypothetical protein GOBAR_AA24757 [Gossypium barbadense]
MVNLRITLSTLLPWKPLASEPKRIKFSFSFGIDNDNLVNDSGTKLTLLPPDMYLQLEYSNVLPLNTFVLVSHTTRCFSFAPVEDFAIYGNLAQMNFMIVYDTEKQMLSFMPTDCSKV